MTERFCRQVNERDLMCTINGGLLRSLFPVALQPVDTPDFDVPTVRQEISGVAAVNGYAGFVDVLDTTIGEPVVNASLKGRADFMPIFASDPMLAFEPIVTGFDSKVRTQPGDRNIADPVHRANFSQRKPFDFVKLPKLIFGRENGDEPSSARQPNSRTRDAVLIEPVVNGGFSRAKHGRDLGVGAVFNVHKLPEFIRGRLPKPAALHAPIGRTARNVISAKPSFDGHMRNAKQITDLPSRHALVKVQRSEVLFGWAFRFHKSKYITFDIPRLGYGGQLA